MSGVSGLGPTWTGLEYSNNKTFCLIHLVIGEGVVFLRNTFSLLNMFSKVVRQKYASVITVFYLRCGNCRLTVVTSIYTLSIRQIHIDFDNCI